MLAAFLWTPWPSGNSVCESNLAGSTSGQRLTLDRVSLAECSAPFLQDGRHLIPYYLEPTKPQEAKSSSANEQRPQPESINCSLKIKSHGPFGTLLDLKQTQVEFSLITAVS